MNHIIFTLLSLILINLSANCQLLKNRALTVVDFDKGLLDPNHLRTILLENDFTYDPLDNEDCLISENWLSKMEDEWISPEHVTISAHIIIIGIYDYKPNFGYRPNNKRLINLIIIKHPDYIDNIELFLKGVRAYYPIRNVSYNKDFPPRIDGPFLVYKKSENSKIEVEVKNTTYEDYSNYDIYELNFILSR